MAYPLHCCNDSSEQILRSHVRRSATMRAHAKKGSAVAAGIDRLLTQRTLGAMLVLCLALTVEEGIHLQRSHPNRGTVRTSENHPGCQLVNPSGTLLRCEINGYGSMLFLCSKKGCAVKEAATG